MSIRQALVNLQAQSQTALIPFITAGDPDLATTSRILKALAAAGADLIEVGVPFSDPMADGAVIQQASERALAKGVHLTAVLEMIQQLRQEGFETPLILFTYFNPVYRLGLAAFASQAQAAGVNAVLVVDLPPEEAGDYLGILKQAELETVFLASPTTPPERLKIVDQASSGCVYYISRAGVTGARSEIAQGLKQDLQKLQAQIQQPVIVGFGISTPEQVRELAGQAAGLVVGSALVQRIADSPDPDTAVQVASDYIQELKAAMEAH